MGANRNLYRRGTIETGDTSLRPSVSQKCSDANYGEHVLISLLYVQVGMFKTLLKVVLLNSIFSAESQTSK